MNQRVLAAVHLYPPHHCAGAERMVQEILRFLAGEGWEARVWTMYDQRVDPYEVDGVPVVGPDVPLDELVEWADVVLTHLDATKTVMEAGGRLSTPVVHVVHNDRQLAHWSVPTSDFIIFNSRWIRAAYPGHDGLVVHPPVNPDSYPPMEGPHNAAVLVNLNDQKGGPTFWNIAWRLQHRRFIGLLGAYGGQCLPPSTLKNCETVEHVDDVRPIYAQARMVLVPSKYESWGRVAVEAMCSGVPVVHSDTPGLKESMGGAGVLLPQHAPSMWARTVEALWDDDRRIEKLVAEGTARAAALWERTWLQLVDLDDRLRQLR